MTREEIVQLFEYGMERLDKPYTEIGAQIKQIIETQKDRNELIRASEISNQKMHEESQQIIKEAGEKRAVLEERKKIYEAIQNGEKINLEEIQDYKNLKLAEDLIFKQTSLDQELDAFTKNLELQREALKQIAEDKKKFEQEWTKFF